MFRTHAMHASALGLALSLQPLDASAHDVATFTPEQGSSVSAALGVGLPYGGGATAGEFEHRRSSDYALSAHIAANPETATFGAHTWFPGRRLRVGLGVSVTYGWSSIVGSSSGPCFDDDIILPGPAGNNQPNGGGNRGGHEDDPDIEICDEDCEKPTPRPPDWEEDRDPNPWQDDSGFAPFGGCGPAARLIAIDMAVDHDIGQPGRLAIRYGLGAGVDRTGHHAELVMIPTLGLGYRF